MVNIKYPNFSLLVAKRNSGKSHLLKYLLYKSLGCFERVYIFCKTSFNKFWSNFPDDWVFEDYDEELIQEIIQEQRELIESGTKRPIALVFDDEIGEVSFHHSKIFDVLATKGRHYNLTVFLTTQYLKKVSPVIRSNSDYVYIFKTSNEENYKLISNEFRVGFNQKEFKKYIDDNTTDYKVIVFDNLSTSNNPKDVYSIVKAPAKLPNFQVIDDDSS